MPKVSIASPDKARAIDTPKGFTGNAKTLAYFDGDAYSIKVHLHRLAQGEVLRVEQMGSTCLGYLWKGSCIAASQRLSPGSSLIVQNDASIEIESLEEDSVLVTFTPAEQTAERSGSNVYLLPSDQVPRYGHDDALSPVSGGLHSDASDPEYPVWLHENRLAAPDPNAPAADADAGVHSHSEDEVIFVTGGQIRLGSRLYGPGTALAIAADTMYGFTVGAEGLSFINFRAGMPKAIHFKNGHVMDEVSYWHDRLGTPQPILIPALSLQ